MQRVYRNILYGYVGFAVANVAVAYFTSNARTGRTPGQNKLLDFNDSLMRFNPLAWLMVPGTVTAMPLTTAANPAIPTGATVTQYTGGTTTTFDSTPSFLPAGVPLTPFN